jgi:hypothetical protein
MNPKARVPFGDYCKQHGFDEFECQGGKEDDITVVAAWVVPDVSTPLMETTYG